MVQAAAIPGFGNEFDLREQRIFVDGFDHGRFFKRSAVASAREDGGQIKAKAVDVHLAHPISKRVDNKLL